MYLVGELAAALQKEGVGASWLGRQVEESLGCTRKVLESQGTGTGSHWLNRAVGKGL